MNSDTFTSNARKYTAQTHVAAPRADVCGAGVIESLLSLIERILAFLFSEKVRIITKSAVTLACVFGFIGLGGGVDRGVISFPVAIVIGALMSAVEILCLRE